MTKFELLDTLPEKKRSGPPPNPVIAAFVDTLRSNPGAWGKWPIKNQTTAKHPSQVAHMINKGQYSSQISTYIGFRDRVRNKQVYVSFQGVPDEEQ